MDRLGVGQKKMQDDNAVYRNASMNGGNEQVECLMPEAVNNKQKLLYTRRAVEKDAKE